MSVDFLALVVSIAIIVLTAGSIVVSLAQRAAAARRRADVRREQQAAKQDVDAASASQPPTSPRYEAEQAVRYKQATEDAEAEIRRHLPVNPRNAKRVLNQLRLAFFIAEKRGLFADGVVTRGHVAKWVLLTEQWPKLGEVLAADRSVLDKIEGITDVDDLSALLREVCRSVKATPEVLELLLKPPALTGVVGRIVRLDDTNQGSAAVETPERGLRSE